MMIKVFGLPNCDSCKKSRRWLDQHKVDYEFVHVRDTPPSAKQLHHWLQQLGWEMLLNRRSTSWRNLSDSEKSGITSEKAKKLIKSNPTLMKRPIVESKQTVSVGFQPEQWQVFLDND